MEDVSRDLADQERSKHVVVLEAPSGSKVYIVGTAHISSQAVNDVRSAIELYRPKVLVLELDAARYKALVSESNPGDAFGLKRFEKEFGTTWDTIRSALRGDLPIKAFQLAYIIGGALLGSRPGGEFIEAYERANSEGLQVILADRDKDVTLSRLAYYAWHLNRGDSRRSAERRRMNRAMDRSQQKSDTTQVIDYDISADPRPTPTEERVKREVEISLRRQREMSGEGPWSVEAAGPPAEDDIEQRLLLYMEQGGCERPEAVLEAAKRMFKDGMGSKSKKISPDDLLEVRQCATKVVENVRLQAMCGNAGWAQQMEEDMMAGASGERIAKGALQKVLIDERNIILARRLWEASEQAQGDPVLGVFGAGHVPGIMKLWPHAGSEQIAQQADSYSQAPIGFDRENTMPILPGVVFAAAFGLMAYRNPKPAALFAGAVATMVGVGTGIAVQSAKRLTRFADKLVEASNQLETDQDGVWDSTSW